MRRVPDGVPAAPAALAARPPAAGCSSDPGRVVETRVVAVECLLGAIARAHERSRDAFEKAARERLLAIAIELRRGNETLHGEVIESRAQVLTERDEIHSGGTQVAECRVDLRVSLAESQHEAALGEHCRAVALGVSEHGECLLVAGARIPHRVRQAAYGLDVLRKHLD